MFVSHKMCCFPIGCSNALCTEFFVLVCYFCADARLRALPLLLYLSGYLRGIGADGI